MLHKYNIQKVYLGNFFFYGEKSLYDPSMSKNTELIFGKVHDKFGKIKIFLHMMEGYCQIAVIDEITET